MRFVSTKFRVLAGVGITALAVSSPALAQDAAADTPAGGEIVVTGLATTYNNTAASEPMMLQQTPLTSPLSMVDNLPGVSVNEGDTFGFDDWSTTVAVRGFQTNLSEQQVGITIDGLPNGGSNYGGGSKANRYIDTMNIGTVEVSQGTADIGSLSNEALGGTLNFTTNDPTMDRRMRFSASLGQFEAQRFYARYDTGDLGGIRAWVSATHQEATDWVNGSAANRRDHFAFKFKTDGAVRLTGYAAYDDTLENNYDNVYSAAQFEMAPHTDGLTAEWTGIPYIDQVYRKAWATLRQNGFGYLKAEAEPIEGLSINASIYGHKMGGRGDWAPPYIVNVTDDGAGNPESELTSGPVEGGAPLGQLFFVDANGVALSPIPGCVSTLTFPYGGTSNPSYDPSCYAPGAVAVQSYRHTHYRKERYGVTADVNWEADLGAIENQLRGGIWYEDGSRTEWRDWHKIIDTRAGVDYANPAYWTQYNRKYPQSTFKWYLQEQVTLGPVKANFGIKQFSNKLKREDLFGQSSDASIDSTSKLLLSGGVQIEPMNGLQLFAGYAENFKALSDSILEQTSADFSNLEPETAENIEAGIRYNSRIFQASATYFHSKFDNRIIFVSTSTGAGPDYLFEGSGGYFNAGGIDSDGFELLANVTPLPGVNLFGSYTHINATYRGTGDSNIDEEQGITPGNRVTGIPRDMFALSASWENGPFRAGLSGKYTGDRAVNLSNSWIASGYFNADAFVGVRGEAISDMLKALDLSLVVNNLFDESYIGGISSDAAWIGAPRTVVFTLTADF